MDKFPPDQRALDIQAIMLGSGRPITAELLLAAADAYEAIKRADVLIEAHRAAGDLFVQANMLRPRPEQPPYVGEAGC